MSEDHIVLLDEHTINQIAAGEVIEAPASVVKELVENSLDAGAGKISIHIREGGLGEIKVVDDGRGIAGEDLEAAFLRYGTSKLLTIEDLYRLDTMGFRGEALASIAAVSRTSLLSKQKESPLGWKYVVEAGTPVGKTSEALKDGTTIKVEELFFNAPVRQKFLKSQLKETGAIVEVVEKLMLSRPDVAMELFVDGRLAQKTRGNGDLRELASQVFSFGAGRGMKAIEGERDGLKIHGLVGDIHQYRGSREYLHFFINGRYIRSKSLARFVEEAYRNRLPIGKHPIGIVYLELPPYLVEVNIHPRKLEVKLDREEEVGSLLRELVLRELLRRPEVVPSEGVYRDVEASLAEPAAWREPESSEDYGVEQLSFSVEPDRLLANPFFPLEIMGTVSETYILAKCRETLYIFDQHAAHERINFEEAQREFAAVGFRTQLLLQPVLVNLSPLDSLKVVGHIKAITDAGVLLESFGEDAFLVRGLPLNMPGEQASGEFLLNLVDRLEKGEGDYLRDYMLEKASCVRSVKAGQRVSREELAALIYRLGECEFPMTCPHGRPTFIKYSGADLEKLFLRRL